MPARAAPQSQTPVKKPVKTTIALVYDFDGTLSPSNMQEYTVLPKLGIAPDIFWARVREEAQARQAEQILTYMRMMFEEVERREDLVVKREDLKAMAGAIELFPGVHDWFSRIAAHVEARSHGVAEVRHYIISSGLKEILEGVAIYPAFANVFACTYHYDKHGRAVFPDRVVNDTSKTQYLFRINKGVEDLNQSANDHMPEAERPIPFKNMIYFGDGDTDVPSFTVTRKNGGHAVAVYNGDAGNALQRLGKCRDLFAEERIDFFAAADYRAGSDLERGAKLILDKVVAGILLDREIAQL